MMFWTDTTMNHQAHMDTTRVGEDETGRALNFTEREIFEYWEPNIDGVLCGCLWYIQVTPIVFWAARSI